MNHTSVIINQCWFLFARSLMIAASRPTNYTVCRVQGTDYYDFMHVNVRDLVNFRIVPVRGQGNCFFRTLSHIIFGNETEHQNVRISLII